MECTQIAVHDALVTKEVQTVTMQTCEAYNVFYNTLVVKELQRWQYRKQVASLILHTL
jgi:hypothetical protein